MPPVTNIDRLLQARGETQEVARDALATVTVVFADVVGSAEYFERTEADGKGTQHTHAKLAERVFTGHRGHLASVIGDSVMAEFPDAIAAARACIQLQQEALALNRSLPSIERLQFRVGVHSGPGFRRGNDVFGEAVDVAAFITRHSGPAQIMISAEVQRVLASEPELRTRWFRNFAGRSRNTPLDCYELLWTTPSGYADIRDQLTAALIKGEITTPGFSVQELSLAPTENVDAWGKETPGSADRLGSRYQLLEMLGRGGMGVVYKARDLETDEIVAIKVLKTEIADHPLVVDRFKDELRLARKITHKNVSRIYEFNRTDNLAYISMEYVEGESLRHVLARFGNLSVAKSVDILRQLCAALREAHLQGIVHRDLKPENIMIDREGRVKVMDFGIACSLQSSISERGLVLGTPGYMSPEQAKGSKVDFRTDIYALGLILREMLTGAAPGAATPLRLRSDSPQSFAGMESTDVLIPAHIRRVIAKCTEQDPVRRFRNVDELESALTGGHAHETEIPTLPARLLNWSKSDAVLLVCAVAGLFAFFYYFPKTSLASVYKPPFDRSVLQHYAKTAVERLGARPERELDSGGDFGAQQWVNSLNRARRNYDYLAGRSGADAAKDAAFDVAPFMNWFFLWQDSSTNRSLAGVANDGSLTYFNREIPNGTSLPATSAEQARPLAERALQDFFHQDPRSLELVTAGAVASGDLGSVPSIFGGSQRVPVAGTEFEWVDRHYRYDLTRRYVVRIVGGEVQSLELTYLPPPWFVWHKPSNWQVAVAIALAVLAMAFGIFRMRRVELGARWRLGTTAIMFVLGVWTPSPLDSLTRVAMAILLGLACAAVWLFVSIALELGLAAMPEKTWTAFALVRPMFLSNAFALAVGRGTLIGFALLGEETAVIRLTQLHLHSYLDGYFHIILPPQYLLIWWPWADRMLDALFQTLGIGLLLGLILAMSYRSIRWRPGAVVVAALAMALTGVHWSMGAIEPARLQIAVLFFDYLVLAFAFAAYDLLTMLVAFFTFAFVWGEYYNILASLDHSGEYVVIALWAVAVVIGVGLASRTRVQQQYKKFSAAVG